MVHRYATWLYKTVLVRLVLAASIPFGMLLARLMGLGNLRQIGSGNIGATNVLRTGNKLAAFLTLLLDGGKGAAAVLLASSQAVELRLRAGELNEEHLVPALLDMKDAIPTEFEFLTEDRPLESDLRPFTAMINQQAGALREEAGCCA